MAVGKTLLGIGLTVLLGGTATWGAVETVSKNKLKNDNENLTNTVLDITDENRKLNNDKTKLLADIRQNEEERLKLIDGLNSANMLKLEALEKVDTLTSQLKDKTSALEEKTKAYNETLAKYNAIIVERDNLQTEVNNLQDEVNSLNGENQSLTAQLQTKTTELEQKEIELQQAQTRLNTLSSEVNTLTQQVSSLEEQIQQKNQEIENLNLTITSLNQTLDERDKQIQDLQERLRISEESTGVEFLYSHFDIGCINVLESDINSQQWRYGFEYVNDLLRWFDYLPALYKYNNLKFIYNDYEFYQKVSSGPYSFSVNYFHNGNGLSNEEAFELLKSMKFNNQEIVQLKLLLNYVDGEYVLNIDIIDKVLTGKFVTDSSSIIDFENNTFSKYSGDIVSFVLGLNCDSERFYDSLIVVRNESRFGLPFEFIDNNTFSLDGEVYYREGTHSPTKTPTAENISIENMGENETERYYLHFADGTGFLRITNLADTSNVQEINLEFVSFDIERKILTFKRIDNGEEIVLTVTAYSDTGTSYGISTAIYNGVVLAC